MQFQNHKVILFFSFRFGIQFATCLQTMLDVRFPERGMTRLERRIANLLDPRFKGCHLSLWNWLGRTVVTVDSMRMHLYWAMAPV